MEKIIKCRFVLITLSNHTFIHFHLQIQSEKNEGEASHTGTQHDPRLDDMILVLSKKYCTYF
jgi:hypothetical protein